ncbi:MAG: hypothetical protein WCL02_01105 [bacterium]
MIKTKSISMQKKIIVHSKLGSLVFVCIIHTANTIEQLKLSPYEFYRKWRISEDTPSLPHYEVELLEMDQLKKISSDVQLHIHKQKGKQFMCYTADLSSVEAAYLMWKAWCVGTVYSLIKAQTTKVINEYDFAPLFTQCKEDQNTFIALLAKEYDITIEEQ